MKAKRRSAVALLCATLPIACGEDAQQRSGATPDGPSSPSSEILVLGAADLAHAFEELVPTYEARSGDRVTLVLGSTGNLAAQIRHGAPADVFFAADEAFLDGLIEAGRIDRASRRAYAIGRLALVVPSGRAPLPGVEALTDPALRVVAIANPEHAPYGRAARQVLERLELWASVEPRLVLGENVAQTLQFVRTGNADAGIVALSLVRPAPGESLPYRLVDDAFHAPLRQVAGVTTTSDRAERARAFLAFVLSTEGREILARYGFEPPRP